MSLADQQQFLSRLLTDAPLRRQFAVDPAAACAAASLTDCDAAHLRALAASDVEVFAQSLIHKRRGQVEHLMPLTCRLLGRIFETLFAEFATASLPCGVKRHQEDAIAFAAFLNEGGIAPQIGEMARYEAACIEAQRAGALMMLRRFRYPIRRLAVCVRQGHDPTNVAPRHCLALWWRTRGTLRHRLISI